MSFKYIRDYYGVPVNTLYDVEFDVDVNEESGYNFQSSCAYEDRYGCLIQCPWCQVYLECSKEFSLRLLAQKITAKPAVTEESSVVDSNWISRVEEKHAINAALRIKGLEGENKIMSFDTDPRDEREEYPCQCGGNIRQIGEHWECDCCDFDSRRKLDEYETMEKKLQIAKDALTAIVEHNKYGGFEYEVAIEALEKIQ